MRSRAEKLGLRIVSDELIDALNEKIGLSTSQLNQTLVKHTISTWQVQEKPNESEKFSTKLQDEVMRFKFKGGAAVDPESGLEAEASVMRDSDGTPMTAVLGMVDLVKGNNSYYRSVGLYVHPFYHFWEVLSNGYIAMYISSYLDVRRLTGV
ncbi:Poly (ADP-ribose) polymerase [Fasciolopsis buskii]|uniref:Poly (ADP-ribose) polymerase n=1 Tax=Fasciolopsis buskii TaxID=27845 RepID=A0A8E0RWG8_9TREM|nr:Poly (ADP-ribose) polymerase [Fasciolopsis buski]